MLPTPIVSGPPAMKRSQDRSQREQEPFESREYITSNSRPAWTPISPTMRTTTRIRQQNRKCNEACEPEDHGYSFCSEYAEFVGCGFEVDWCYDEVGDGEEGPY